jgi:hypothetical protein
MANTMTLPKQKTEQGNVTTPNGQDQITPDDVQDRDGSLRSQQINDYEQRACQSADPRARAIGTINSGLMRIGTELEATLIEAMKDNQMTLAQIPETSEAFNVHLRYARMIERFARLEQQFERPKKNG